jgi:phage gp29-like protein
MTPNLIRLAAPSTAPIAAYTSPAETGAPPPLVDHLGRPLRPEQMTMEVAGPTTTGVRNITSGHPAQGLDPQRLATLLRAAEDGDAVAYLELAEEMEEKDLHYLSVLGTRKRAISQLPIEVIAAGDTEEQQGDAQLIRDWLDRDTLESELFDILDAIGKAFSVTEIVWEMSSKTWLPGKLKWRDPRWFEFDRVDGETLRLRDIGESQPLAAFKYIQHVHPAKSGLTIRSGLARPVAWFYLFKNYSIKDWATFLDAYGMPLRVGKYENGTTEDNIRLLMRALANLGSDAAAAIPKSMEVEFIDRKGGENGDIFKSMAEFCDLQVSKAVLGQTSTTDAVAGGLGSGQANTHNDVRGDIERADAKLLAATLNRDLIQPIVMLNRGHRDKYPKLRIGRAEEIDLKNFLAATDAALRYGVPVGKTTFRAKTGLPAPADDEELLEAPATAAAPADGGANADAV